MYSLKPLLLWTALSVPLFSAGQTGMTAQGENTRTVLFSEVMPQFPGGDEAMQQYIDLNLNYPRSAHDEKLEGMVIVGYLISSTGAIRDVKIIRGIREDLDNAALELVKGFPRYQPGYDKGEPVNVKYHLPVVFKLKPGDQNL